MVRHKKPLRGLFFSRRGEETLKTRKEGIDPLSHPFSIGREKTGSARFQTKEHTGGGKKKGGMHVRIMVAKEDRCPLLSTRIKHQTA